MHRQELFLFFAALPLIAIQPLLASTVQVGTCLPNIQSYSTISAAVSAVPAGSTVEVCPGTYAEQVTISSPLTLVGITSGTSNQALITVPTAGLLPSTTSMFGESVAAQIFVSNAGQVNISNITVDGSGGDMGCASNVWVAGIFYSSGSSGSVTRARTSNQTDGTCGVGIWAENSAATSESVKIEDSTVYNADSAGIFAGSGTTPSLSVSLNNNVVNAGTAVAGVDMDSVIGTAAGNDLVGSSSFGVFDISGSHVTSNTIMGPTDGVYLGNGGTASANHISGASLGILLGAGGATLSNNRVMSSLTAAVELGCYSATVSGNFINDAPIGVDSAAAALGLNSFANTGTTVTNGCAAPVAAVAAFRALSSNSTSLSSNSPNVVKKRANVSEWHTPATPLGTRTK